jgi:hypothetical protein
MTLVGGIDGGQEVPYGPVIAGGDCAKLLEADEEGLDQKARLVEVLVEGAWPLAVDFAWITAVLLAAFSRWITRLSASNASSAIKAICYRRTSISDYCCTRSRSSL